MGGECGICGDLHDEADCPRPTVHTDETVRVQLAPPDAEVPTVGKIRVRLEEPEVKKFEAVFTVSSVGTRYGKKTVFGSATTADGYDIAMTGGSANLGIHWPEDAKLPKPGQGLRIILTDEVVSEPKPYVPPPEDPKQAAKTKNCEFCKGSGLQVSFDGEGDARPYKEGDKIDPHDEVSLCSSCH